MEAIRVVTRLQRSTKRSRLRQTAWPNARAISERAGRWMARWRECDSRQKVSQAPGTASSVASVLTSLSSSMAVMMAVAGRASPLSGCESTAISPSADAGSCMSFRAEARCAMAPSSLTAARNTSKGSAACARSSGTSCGTKRSKATWLVAHSRSAAARVSSVSRSSSGLPGVGRTSGASSAKPLVLSRRKT